MDTNKPTKQFPTIRSQVLYLIDNGMTEEQVAKELKLGLQHVKNINKYGRSK